MCAIWNCHIYTPLVQRCFILYANVKKSSWDNVNNVKMSHKNKYTWTLLLGDKLGKAAEHPTVWTKQKAATCRAFLTKKILIAPLFYLKFYMFATFLLKMYGVVADNLFIVKFRLGTSVTNNMFYLTTFIWVPQTANYGSKSLTLFTESTFIPFCFVWCIKSCIISLYCTLNQTDDLISS